MIRVLQVVGRMALGGTQTMIMNVYHHIDRTQMQFDFVVHTRDEYLYVISDREMGKKIGLGIFDRNYHQLEAVRADEKLLSRKIKRPDNFEEMIEIAEKLAGGFPEVRVDLYNVERKIIFGEMTFLMEAGI